MFKKCPKCGYERQQDEITPEYECPSCGIIYAKYQEKLNQKNIQGAAPSAEQPDINPLQPIVQPTPPDMPSMNNDNADSQHSTSQNPLKKYVNPVLVASIVAALAIVFIGYKVYLNIEERRGNSEFSAMVGSVSEKLIKLAIESETVVDEINNAWRDAIFNKDALFSSHEKRDFNVAIYEVLAKRSFAIESIEKLSKEIGDDIKKTVPPNGKEKDYQRLKELYLLFNKYSSMAVSPSGSLQTYSQQNNELSLEIRSGIKELEMMK